jgi:N-acetylneuraminate lyase
MESRNVKLTGLIAAPFTPFDAQANLAADRIPAYAAFLRDHGVAGVFVNGSTGESLSLSMAERKATAEAWQATKGTLKVVVHVGTNSVVEARELAAHAQAIGVDAIGAMPPCFFKAGLGGVVDYCEAVAAAAPELPFYYYHIPSMTRVDISVRELLEQAERRIPNLAGAKYTFENLMDFQQAIEYKDGRFDLLFGRDEMLLNGLAAGAVGAVGSTYNFMAGVYLKVIAAFQANDLATARLWQAKSQQLVNILQESGSGIACCKAIMGLAGVDCGPCRIPLPRFDSAKMAWLRCRLDQIGFFRW